MQPTNNQPWPRVARRLRQRRDGCSPVEEFAAAAQLALPEVEQAQAAAVGVASNFHRAGAARRARLRRRPGSAGAPPRHPQHQLPWRRRKPLSKTPRGRNRRPRAGSRVQLRGQDHEPRRPATPTALPVAELTYLQVAIAPTRSHCATTARRMHSTRKPKKTIAQTRQAVARRRRALTRNSTRRRSSFARRLEAAACEMSKDGAGGDLRRRSSSSSSTRRPPAAPTRWSCCGARRRDGEGGEGAARRQVRARGGRPRAELGRQAARSRSATTGCAPARRSWRRGGCTAACRRRASCATPSPSSTSTAMASSPSTSSSASSPGRPDAEDQGAGVRDAQAMTRMDGQRSTTSLPHRWWRSRWSSGAAGVARGSRGRSRLELLVLGRRATATRPQRRDDRRRRHPGLSARKLVAHIDGGGKMEIRPGARGGGCGRVPRRGDGARPPTRRSQTKEHRRATTFSGVVALSYAWVTPDPDPQRAHARRAGARVVDVEARAGSNLRATNRTPRSRRPTSASSSTSCRCSSRRRARRRRSGGVLGRGGAAKEKSFGARCATSARARARRPRVQATKIAAAGRGDPDRSYACGWSLKESSESATSRRRRRTASTCLPRRGRRPRRAAAREEVGRRRGRRTRAPQLRESAEELAAQEALTDEQRIHPTLGDADPRGAAARAQCRRFTSRDAEKVERRRDPPPRPSRGGAARCEEAREELERSAARIGGKNRGRRRELLEGCALEWATRRARRRRARATHRGGKCARDWGGGDEAAERRDADVREALSPRGRAS